MRSDIFDKFSGALKESFATAVAQENDALIDDLITFLEQRRSTPRLQVAADYEEFDCDTCGTRFKPLEKVVRVRHAYCSDECKNKESVAPAEPAETPKAQTITCADCKKDVPRTGHRQKYCTDCRSKTAPEKTPQECPECGNEFIPYSGRQKFCSDADCKKDRQRKYMDKLREERGPSYGYRTDGIEPEKAHLFLDEPEPVEPSHGKDYTEYKQPNLSRYMPKLPEGIVGHGVAASGV